MAERPEEQGAGEIGHGVARPLDSRFEEVGLPLQPPFPPMEAERSEAVPRGEGWWYEPKWDGFRALIYLDGEHVEIQSKAGQPLARYFPEVVALFADLPAPAVVDGEIVIQAGEKLDFDALLQRIHPARSRIERLAGETPASFIAFDLLVSPEGRLLTDLPQRERRQALEDWYARIGEHERIRLSPLTDDHALAERWLGELGSRGLEGVMAKRTACNYRSGKRDGMVKIKRLKTADCVVGGYRLSKGGKGVGTLLLGLYNDEGRLDQIGSTSSFKAREREELLESLLPYAGRGGFDGKQPGPSRWKSERDGEYVPLEPVLVCEVRYDYFQGGRFRHATRFLRWRPEKKPEDCTYGQILTAPSSRNGQ